jgi:hypothetical protein
MLCLVLNHSDTPEHFQHEVSVKFPWPYEHTYFVEQKTGFILFKLCLYMYAICLGIFLGHHQECQYKNLIKEDKMK